MLLASFPHATLQDLKDLIAAAVKEKAKAASAAHKATTSRGGEQASVMEAVKEELVNQVDDSKHGYGAIHYLAKGNYTYKIELLVTLAIHGNADLDLTTTNRNQQTALHLAIEVCAIINILPFSSCMHTSFYYAWWHSD